MRSDIIWARVNEEGTKVHLRSNAVEPQRANAKAKIERVWSAVDGRGHLSYVMDAPRAKCWLVKRARPLGWQAWKTKLGKQIHR